MIDLETTSPRHEIRVGEEWVEVNTSFREWLRFSRLLEKKILYTGIFPGEAPDGNWLEGALEFMKDENVLPNGSGSGVKAIDPSIDSDYIVGAFWQTYGIDLTTEELHWHVYLALLRSLPRSTKLMEIVGYRLYEKTSKKQEDLYAEMRSKWALPLSTEERESILAEQQALFGGLNG